MNRFEDFNANFVPNEPQPDHPGFEERWLEDEAASKILDDAQEKIAELFRIAREEGAIRKWVDGMLDAKEALNLSGTTDIECPECKGKGDFRVRRCGKLMKAGDCLKCQGSGKFKHKWKIAVVLENGELPENPYTSISTPTDRWLGYGNAKKDMLDEGWVKEVRQVVE